MGLLDNLINHHVARRSEEYQKATAQIEQWSSFIASILETNGLIERSSYSSKLRDLYQFTSYAEKVSQRFVLFSTDETKTFREEFCIFQTTVNHFESNIESHNVQYLKTVVNDARSKIGKIEGHDLDDQQMMCILKDAHSHNVVAGAGTGKTTTIIGKVKYLLNTGKYKPNEILVLSYTRAASSEMRNRLKQNTSADITVLTFHRFGYNILTYVEKKKPNIYTDGPQKVIKEEFSRLLQDKTYMRMFLRYIGNTFGTEKSDLDTDFTSYEEYQSYVREHRPITLRGETVRSYGEMHLANILAINGIPYVYEQSYEHDTATEKYAQYKPDFYLPDYRIYIEYFGIDRNGNAPEWFEGDNPTQSYQDGIRWKRNIHKQYKTSLIECYAYEDSEGILQESLEKKLVDAGVKLNIVSVDQLLQYSGNNTENVINTFISSAASVINLARNRKISADLLINVAHGNRHVELIAKLISPLQRAYENYLSVTNQIDFADMLIKAETYVNEDKYHSPYKCVIVDEYQDVTASQYNLLKAIRDKTDFDLFCVGDDWQSIYQFNGSDVSYIMDFEEFWGGSELSRIETTYRFSQSLIDISSRFIMQNPRQIKKSIRSGITANGFAVSKIEGYRQYDAIHFMTDRLMYLPKGSSVFLIGRYTFDIKLLEAESRLSVRFDTATQTQKVFLKGRRDLDIVFYTAHRSKGLQADYVCILNNSSGTLGFPSKVENNPLTNCLLVHGDNYPFAEERRLFYVALTRAKKHVYLLTIKDKESPFIKELEETYSKSFVNETYICPKCGGKLRLINGAYGRFFGCENYRATGCSFSSKLPE